MHVLSYRSAGRAGVQILRRSGGGTKVDSATLGGSMSARASRSSEDEPTPGSVAAAATAPDADRFAIYDEPMASPASPNARVTTLLRAQASRIVANWVLRAANLPAFRAVPNLTLDRMEQAIPALLDASLTAVGSSDPTMDPEPLARALELAADHGRARAGEGFGIGVLLSELHQLRLEVWTALWRIVDADPTLAGAPRELQSRLSSTFDSLATAAAEAWVEARLPQGDSARR
jgi:hypothetical protein